MLTCFGSIAAIISAPPNSSPSDIISLLQRTPFDRLRHAVGDLPEIQPYFEELARHYVWFLEQTNVSEEELNTRFSIKSYREDSFARAELFGDNMFEIIKALAEKTGYLRYLIV